LLNLSLKAKLNGFLFICGFQVVRQSGDLSPADDIIPPTFESTNQDESSVDQEEDIVTDKDTAVVTNKPSESLREVINQLTLP
jgi:hypothetical protein